LIELIDKNLFWGGLNIRKREFCVKVILAQDLGFIWGGLSNSGFAKGFYLKETRIKGRGTLSREINFIEKEEDD